MEDGLVKTCMYCGEVYDEESGLWEAREEYERSHDSYHEEIEYVDSVCEDPDCQNQLFLDGQYLDNVVEQYFEIVKPQ